MKNGRLPYNAVQRSILRPMKAAGALPEGFAQGYDCAVVQGENGCMASSSAVMVLQTPAYLRVGYFRACNQLLSQQVQPGLINASFLWPASAKEEEINQAVRQLAQLCAEEGVLYGMTTAGISSAVTKPVLTIQAAGARQNSAGPDRLLRKWEKEAAAETVCSLLLAGHAGMAGIGLLAAAGEAALTRRYTPGFIRQGKAFLQALGIAPMVQAAEGEKVCFYPVQEGGVLAALWNFADGRGLGLDIDLTVIPIRQETVEISEFYQINPYQLMGDGGCLIAAENPQVVLERLHHAGITARCIGTVTKSKARILRREDEVRYLDKPAQDELERLTETGENQK